MQDATLLAPRRFSPDDVTTALAALTRYARRGLSLAHLALRSAGELTDLVAEMHAVIARAPFPFARLRPDAASAPFPYRIVAGSLRQTAQALAAIPAQAREEAEASALWWRLVAVLNGVMGDKLEAWDNALATPLALVDAKGQAQHPLALLAQTGAGGSIVLFAHGLCLSEQSWQYPAHQAWVENLSKQGHAVGYLRYNSGRAIYRNGEDLSRYLDAHYGLGSGAQLALIGHSMGGLLFRSAFEHARLAGHGWIANVSHCAFLATPHHGAPLERIGNLANGLLSITPYSLPFMRLGNIRSRGIKDLRYASLTQAVSTSADDSCNRDPRQCSPELPGQVRYLLLSAALAEGQGGDLLGDGLVPVASARGEHPDPRFSLRAASLQRQHLPELGHMAMLASRRLYAVLAEWLEI